MRALNGFHNNIARHLTNKQARRIHPAVDDWMYTSAEDALEETNLLPVEDYIIKRKQNLLHWAQNRQTFLEARNLEQLMEQKGRFWCHT
jgi:hypothetical protein